ncbi:MAG: Cyclic di-AMP synthase CdaA [Chlamydiia bacterium]|nr:Cyclic di-AMP synthase CdaA [Chlamydiia bacterium]MCH9615819.1 Cyclic di-AMP synthase CdaA [Chlamydiia bacterium]MCH9628778.1 Cyclic di-AMP synthase CdaA [Chlamydiia bacterium]
MHFFIAVTPLIEVVIITVMINYLLSFFWNTRSMDLMLGMLAFLLIFAASSLFHLPILHKLMYLVANVAVIAILIIFQPELRVALSKLSVKGKRYKEITEFDKFLDQLANSTYKLSDKRIGALIVIENEDSLEEYARKAVMLNAIFSSELLESIFTTSTPLHDGGVIIHDRTIVAASVILPLAEDTTQIAKSMGTRHRAALGASQMTDALLIVVSEETGKVSIARDGIMTRGVKIDRFKGIIRSIFNPPASTSLKPKFKIKEWLKR